MIISSHSTAQSDKEIISVFISFQDELLQGLSNKQPKVVAGCVQTLTMALRYVDHMLIMVDLDNWNNDLIASLIYSELIYQWSVELMVTIVDISMALRL